MNTKEIIKIINEEIDRFDYLSKDKNEMFDQTKNVIDSKEFKINFINDVLINNTNTLKFIEVVGSKKNNNNQNNVIDLDKSDLFYEIHLYYEFLNKEYEFTLLLEGKNIKTSPEIDYDNIDITLICDDNNEEIDLDWLKTDKELYKNFINLLIKNDFNEN